MGRLQEKVVVVTGGAQGTGEATARLAAREGARVVVADIQSEKAAAVAKSLGDGAISCELDVSSEESWRAAVRVTVDEFARLERRFRERLRKSARINVLGAKLASWAIVESLPRGCGRLDGKLCAGHSGMSTGRASQLDKMRSTRSGWLVRLEPFSPPQPPSPAS